MSSSGVSAPGTTNFRLRVEWTLLLLAAVGLVLTAHWRGWTERLDLRLLDFATQAVQAEPFEDILIVEIDDYSLSQEDAWPWDRARHAVLVEQAAELAPRAIVFDVLFQDPLSAEGDDALSAAMARAGNVALAHSFSRPPNSEDGRIAALPLPALAEQAFATGHVSVVPDSDGIVRRFSLSENVLSGEHKHLAVALLQAVGFDNISDSGQAIVPLGDAEGFDSIPASELFDGSLARGSVEGKIILIGSTAPGLGDRYAVPDHAGRVMPGVELLANLISGLATDTLIDEAPQTLVLGLLIASVALLLLAFWHLPPRKVLLLSVGLIGVLLAVSLLSVAVFRIWMPVGPALLAIVIAYPLWGWRRLASVSRYLEREASALQAELGETAEPDEEGFDTIARQVARLAKLSGKVRNDFAFMRGVIDASPDPMLVLDGEGRLQLLNQPASRLFAYQEGGEAPLFEELVLGTRASIDHDRHELIAPGGKVFLIANATLDAENGSEIVAFRDVTPLKQAERQRQEMLEFLSHDMRSPQVAIIGMAGAVGRDTGSRIEREARRTLKLAEDFVQIARLEQAGISKEDTELGGLLFEAADRAHALAKAKNIKVDSDLPEEPLFCDVDPFAMSRAVDNLMSNAIKFSPESSSVTLAMQSRDEGFVDISVSDEGPGLPEERREDPFARFGSRDRSGQGGTGLGLAYVAKVIAEHKGEVRAEDIAGGGTRFVMSLPWVPDPGM